MSEEAIIVLDAGGHPLGLGCEIDGGNGVVGELIEIRDGDEGGPPKVGVLWPGADGTEQFTCRPKDYRREGPSGPYVWVCDDVAVIA